MVQVFNQPDPATQYKMQLAQQLMKRGQDTSPIKHPLQGLARAGSSIYGGYLAKQGITAQKKRRTDYTQSIADALKAGQGAKPWVNPDTGKVAPGQPSRSDRIAQALGGNPDTAAMGLQMQLGQLGRADKLNDARALKVAPGFVAPKSPVPGRDVPYPAGVFGQKESLAQAGRPQNIGTIPPGYQVQTDGGVTRMVPIPGGPAAGKIKETEAKKAERKTQVERQGNIVIEDIGRALKMADSSFTTGFLGSLTQGIPGSSAHDLSNILNTIKANVGFDKLQAMRAASKTGGALGQVSEMENKLLQSTLGALEQSQGKEQFLYNLKRLNNVYLDIIHGGGSGPERMPLEEPEEPSIEEILKKHGGGL